jgi:chromatin assembly factor 1 subunit A
LLFIFHCILTDLLTSRQKQKDKEAKEEERRKREEAKEEEKKRKEEEKLEAERKKQKAASNFASFFVSKKHEVKQTEEENVIEAKNFMPFEIKTDMKIAPICRRTLSEREKLLLDEKCNTGMQRSVLYLQDIKKGRIVPRTSPKTWPLEAKDDDVIPLGTMLLYHWDKYLIFSSILTDIIYR